MKGDEIRSERDECEVEKKRRRERNEVDKLR